MRSTGFALLAVLAGFAPDVAEAAEGERKRVSLELEAKLEARDVIERRIREQGELSMRRLDVLPASDHDDPVIRVEIDADEASLGYLVRIVTSRAGKVVPGSERRLTCALCTEGELVERVETALAQQVGELERAEPRAPQPAPANAAPQLQAPVRPLIEASRSETDRSRLGALGKASVGVFVTAAVSTAVGIGLLVNPAVPDRSNPLREIYTQPPGYALLAVGAAGFVAGAVMLAIDGKRRRGSPRTGFSPIIGRGQIGMHLSTRF